MPLRTVTVFENVPSDNMVSSVTVFPGKEKLSSSYFKLFPGGGGEGIPIYEISGTYHLFGCQILNSTQISWSKFEQNPDFRDQIWSKS